MLTRTFYRHMHLIAPSIFQHMTKLNREQFTQTIRVPSIVVPVECCQLSAWRKYLLTLPALNNVRDIHVQSMLCKQVLFDPEKIRSQDELIAHLPSVRSYANDSFVFVGITVTYENYSIDQVIKAVLPEHLMNDRPVNTGSGFSIIGHIAHFNLKDDVLPYKYLIGK
jgi:tRNA (guanine37-N1)-methyltransferase